MTQPITYTSRTARFDLPLLFAGQAQKEFTVNDALTRISAVLHMTVGGESDTPPSTAEEGECWLVAPSATGSWEGHDGSVACRIDDAWAFVEPVIGQRCYDTSAEATLFYDGAWQRPQGPAAIDGGATQDTEARAAIADLVAALEQSGII